jgi:hypothetical protein
MLSTHTASDLERLGRSVSQSWERRTLKHERTLKQECRLMLRNQPARAGPLHLLTAALLLTAGSATLAGCRTRQSDELALRREFAVPWEATVLRYETSAVEPGWFGREGLRITMVIRLPPAAAQAFTREVVRSGQWRPLPIPTAELRHLAAIRTVLAQRARTAQLTGIPLQPAGTVYNPTADQMLESFRGSLQHQPARGWYQIRTAGNNILWAPKRIPSPLRDDVNDFMLAVLDPADRTLAIRVSSSY